VVTHRPFESVEEMDAELVRRYNAVVKPEDVVYWLGDVSFHPTDKSAELIGSLHGHKILCLGNHDRSAAAMSRMGFSMVVREAVTHICGRTVRMSHFPPKEYYDPRYKHAAERHKDLRPLMHKGEWLLHGHTHGTERIRGRYVHVGVDAWDFTPVSVPEIEALIGSSRLENV